MSPTVSGEKKSTLRSMWASVPSSASAISSFFMLPAFWLISAQARHHGEPRDQRAVEHAVRSARSGEARERGRGAPILVAQGDRGSQRQPGPRVPEGGRVPPALPDGAVAEVEREL